MNANSIPIVAVSYNAPDLIDVLLRSIRKFYPNPVYIIDGSRPEIAAQIAPIAQSHPAVQFIPFGYNIHHGPGMAWAINHLDFSGPVLFLDSDVEILNGGFLESLLGYLTPELYGVGDITYPQLGDSPLEYRGIGYLSPVCMLCNVEVMRRWPMPIKHGAPMILPMQALFKAGKSDLIGQVDWVKNDYSSGTTKRYFRHDWQGTVSRTGGYHYDDEPVAADYNYDLLPLIPKTAENVMEIGCGNGSLARAYKSVNPVCNFTGMDKDAALVNIARKPCDFVFHADIETMDDDFFEAARSNDCWIFAEVLEYLRDPAAVLAKIRKVIPADGCIIACLPNMQHWSVQARLNQGVLHDGSAPLLNPGTLQWFTRMSMIQLFQTAGFQLAGGAARVSADAGEKYYPAIQLMAQIAGVSPEVAVQDAIPLQYIVKAIPA